MPFFLFLTDSYVCYKMVQTHLDSSKSVAKLEKIIHFDSDFKKGKEREVKMGRKSVCKSDNKGKKP